MGLGISQVGSLGTVAGLMTRGMAPEEGAIFQIYLHLLCFLMVIGLDMASKHMDCGKDSGWE